MRETCKEEGTEPELPLELSLRSHSGCRAARAATAGARTIVRWQPFQTTTLAYGMNYPQKHRFVVDQRGLHSLLLGRPECVLLSPSRGPDKGRVLLGPSVVHARKGDGKIPVDGCGRVPLRWPLMEWRHWGPTAYTCLPSPD